MKSRLTLKNLSLMVNLGATDKERDIPQIVILDLYINFKALPKACFTDQIADTVCYDGLIKKIKQFCDKKTFNLLEHLGLQLYDFIKNIISNFGDSKQIAIGLHIKKNPPILGLGSSTFSIGELI
jgi:7,8-dihydroneopterin aldolase/epimerase/oxygenase